MHRISQLKLTSQVMPTRHLVTVTWDNCHLPIVLTSDCDSSEVLTNYVTYQCLVQKEVDGRGGGTLGF